MGVDDVRFLHLGLNFGLCPDDVALFVGDLVIVIAVVIVVCFVPADRSTILDSVHRGKVLDQVA